MSTFGPELKRWTDDINREQLSPMMRQYVEQKEAWPDCLLFFRLGDFYELFFDDALVAAEALEITLTSRDCGLPERAPMCGVPHHAADQYLARLMDQNYKVAICEQMEDPAEAKGLVLRQVTRVVTPGTITDLHNLDETSNHYLVSVFQQKKHFGLAAIDLTAGLFEATAIVFGDTEQKLRSELMRLKPAEILLNQAAFAAGTVQDLLKDLSANLTVVDQDSFRSDPWRAHLPTDENQAVGRQLWASASAGLLSYIAKTQQQIPDNIGQVTVYDTADYMALDRSARRNLELTETLRDRKRQGSLLWAVDRTVTAMGSRLLRRWLEQPLLRPADINLRQTAVAALKNNFIVRQELRKTLKGMGDLERLTGKLSLGSANARDLLALGNTLTRLPAIKEQIGGLEALYLTQLNEGLAELGELCKLLAGALVEDPPVGLQEGGLIQPGFDKEVDRLREADVNGRQWILDLEAREREKTGIKNLKVGYNRVFGYYIEVTKSYLKAVPDHYIRKQTLTNSERYFTEELKGMEDTILGARQRSIEVEYELFCQIRKQAKGQVEQLLETAHNLAVIDSLQGLAEQADRAQYCRPVVDDSSTLAIDAGRHPVVERMLGDGAFVPNDAYLNQEDSRLLLLTGPNMSGKSTYMRQVAQIVLLAQIGAFVPAEAAHIGVVDAIFTRIGASDDLAGGDSTFMVEMKEVALILQEATPQSLLILDEIGRGTSTYDGLSIAWAVMEAITDSQRLGCRTLFATHYHELTELEGKLEGVKNYHVAVDDSGTDIVFLHRIERGRSDESYGVEVAKLAGIPRRVVERADALLHSLEKNKGKTGPRQAAPRDMAGQLDLFSASLSLRAYDDIIEKIKAVDVMSMSPLEALSFLDQLQKEAREVAEQ